MSIPQLRKTAAVILADKKADPALKDFALSLLGTTDNTLMQFTLAYLNVPSDAIATLGVKNAKPSKKIEKKQKDPNMPKRPINAYFEWVDKEYPLLKAKHDDWTSNQLTKELGRIWQTLDDEEKKDYQERADERFKKWKADKTAYLASKNVASTNVDLKASSVALVVEDDDDEEQEEIEKTAKILEKKTVAPPANWHDEDDDEDIPAPAPGKKREIPTKLGAKVVVKAKK